MIAINILGKLFDVKKDISGSERYTACKYLYKSIKEQFPELTHEEFKEEISNLYIDGYINPDIHKSSNGEIDGSIEITQEGLIYYLFNHDMKKIGV